MTFEDTPQSILLESSSGKRACALYIAESCCAYSNLFIYQAEVSTRKKMSSSSSSSSDNNNTKLIVTAIGAAITGAVLTFGITTYSNNRKKDRTLTYYEKSLNIDNKQPHTTYIYEDASSSLDTSNPRQVILPHNHEERMRRIIAARASVEDDNAIPRRSVTVRVPATSANMGPGCTFIFFCVKKNLCVYTYVLHFVALSIVSFPHSCVYPHTLTLFFFVLHTYTHTQTIRLAWQWIYGVK
jgi:hypothetical protein